MINYDFGADPSFSSIFSTSTDASLLYDIPYTTDYPDLFTPGATAYVSFSRIKFNVLCTTYKVNAVVVQVTSTSVQVRIEKTGNTVVEELKGQILIVSDFAASNRIFI